MKMKVAVPLILFFVLISVCVLFIPIHKTYTFTEQRTEEPQLFYIPMKDVQLFQIRYVHSIHLTNVIESYKVTNNDKIRLLSMRYEDLAIGLPGYAEAGETISFEDGVYTLTYDDKVIDSFVLFVGDVDADLVFRYQENEIDLKKHLTRGKSYLFNVTKLSYYQMLKGVDMNGKRY